MRNVAIVGAVAVATSVLLAVLLPASFHVERSVAVAAAPATVLGQLADLQRWPGWSPAEARDPRISRRYGGRVGSPGMTYYWSGNREVGRGRMTLVGVAPDRLDLEVETEEPYRATADVTIRVVAEGDRSRVSWSVDGENGPLDRLVWFLARRGLALERAVEERLPFLQAAAAAVPARPLRRVEARTRVGASPASVRARLLDLPGWRSWAPWAAPASGEPVAGGTPGQVGSSLYWAAGSAPGARRITLVTDRTAEVEVELVVGDGSSDGSTHDLEFRITDEGAGSLVTWAVSGDGAVTVDDLTRGLARLKALSEAHP